MVLNLQHIFKDYNQENMVIPVLKDINLDSHYTYIQDIEDLDIEDVIDSIKDNKIHDRNIFKESEKQFEILDKYILG